MNTIFRCHIKNDERLELFRRSLQSWKDKELWKLGKLYVVDDQSPLQVEVEALAKEFDAVYFRTTGTRSTKNGLYWSLKIQNEFPVLCCVDDMVFGESSMNRLNMLVMHEYPRLKNTGIVGLFVCYDMQTRNQFRFSDVDLWMVPIALSYALVCHLFSKDLSDILIRDYEKAAAENREVSIHQDDLWVKEVCLRDGLVIYNTVDDYAWHTGANTRTFGDDPIGNSSYQTPRFVGE
jgi:hypothetical protein